MTDRPEWDKTKAYLVPVARLNLDGEPDHVHLALCVWQERVAAWTTQIAICGRSTEQGALPDETDVTCPNCLTYKSSYERIVWGNNNAARLEAEVRRQQDMAEDTPENGAWHTVWLESGRWRWTTAKMTTEQREYAADRVAAYSRFLAACDDDLGRGEPEGLRWWRDDR